MRIKTRAGITEQLAKCARGSTDGTTAVVVEGPYGGLEERLSSFDDVLLVAGGIGSTVAIPMAEQLTRLGNPFRLIWSVKSKGNVRYFRPRRHITDLSESSAWFTDSQIDPINIQLHVTGTGVQPLTDQERKCTSPAPDNDVEKKSFEEALTSYPGRPDVARLVRDFGRDAAPRSRVAVIGRSGHLRSIMV